MPFRSEKQRRYLWANEPEIAREWTDRYGARGGGIMRIPFANGLRATYPDFMWSSPQFTEGLDNSMYGGDRSLIGRNVNPTVNYYTGDTAPKNHPSLRVGDDGITRYDFDEPRPLGFDTSYGVANEADVAQKPLTQKKGLWDSITGGITNVLDNTMIGKIAAMNNALNPRAWNYNPALQGQIDFMKDQGRYGVMDASGLNKITGGVLQGKGLQSFFGSNDLGKMYDKSIAQTQKTINNIKFGKQWSTLKKDNPDEYYKKLAFHQNKLKQKEREKKAADIAARADLDKRKAASKANWQQDYSTWTSPSGRDHATTGGIGSPESKKGPAGGSIGASRFLARGGRASYFNGGLASLWPR